MLETQWYLYKYLRRTRLSAVNLRKKTASTRVVQVQIADGVYRKQTINHSFEFVAIDTIRINHHAMVIKASHRDQSNSDHLGNFILAENKR